MKKIIIIASIVLIFIIIFSLILRKKSATNTSSISPFPTSIPRDSSGQTNLPAIGGDQGLKDITGSIGSTDSTNSFIANIPPVETADFKLQYFPKQNKIYLERKTVFAEQKFAEWANQNNYPQLINNPDLVSIVNIGQAPLDFNPMIEFLNIFMNFGQGSQQPGTAVPSSTPQSSNSPQNPSSTLNPPSSGFTYFAQCNGYGNLSLPSGCTLCKAGCGPTTVAMIAASYLGLNYNPKTIVDTYRSNGYLLGCVGSRYTDAKQVLQNLGLKTTDYLVFGGEKADTVASELRPYLNAGWTFFILANFRVDGGGHFFWITDIDNQDNIFAYDPYYGRSEIPYNENSRYPYPLYRVAFGVKK